MTLPQSKNKSGVMVQGARERTSQMSSSRGSMRIAGLPPSNPERISGLQTRPAIQLARRKGNASAASPTASWGSFSLATKKRVKKSDLVVAWSQLSIMIQSGDDLASALQMVAHQCKHSGLREVLLAIYRDVQEGTSLSAAMAKHPKVFDVSMVAVIDAGENSGKLVQVLERMTTLMQRDQQLKSNVLSMLTYPAVLLFITSSVISSMFFFVLPQFAKVFQDMERPVPPITSFLLAIGTTLQTHWILIVCFAGALAAGLLYARRLPQWRYVVDYIVLNMVGFRQASRPLMAGRIFRLMGTMIENGVPLLETVRLTQRATQNVYYRDMLRSMERDILEGKGIGPAVSAFSFFPSGAGHMLETGERSAKLAFVLQTIGDYYENEGEQKLRWFVKLLEPTMIITLGGVVGTVVMSIVLPMLDITTAS